MDYRVCFKETCMDDFTDIKVNEQLCDVLCYPKANSECCRRRISFLKKHGINSIVSYGSKIVGKLRVIDIGYSSIIVLALTDKDEIVALKLLRRDSRRNSLSHECNITLMASKLGVSPRIYTCNDEIIVLEFIDGTPLAYIMTNITNSLNDHSTYTNILKTWLKAAIYKAYLLDIHGIDHGELSRPYKHILISPRGVFIIDYESASTRRKTTNVTSIVSGLLIRENKLTLAIRSILGLDDESINEIILILKEYKNKGKEYKYIQKILQKLG